MTQLAARTPTRSAPTPVGALSAGAALLGGGALVMNDVPAAGAVALVVPPLALVGFTRWRSSLRRRLQRDIAEGVTPVTGPGVEVRCSRYAARHYLDPQPGLIEIRYRAFSKDWDAQKWTSELLAAVSYRVGIDYRVHRHLTPKKRIYLVPDRPVDEEPEAADRTVLEAKVAVAVEYLLGDDAEHTLEWGEGNVLGAINVEFSHKTTMKLASRMKRVSIERVITATMPNRWRAQWDVECSTVRFEVRPELPDSGIPHPPPGITAANRYRIPIAVTEDREVVSWNLRSTEPHGITNGRTGTGKTVVLLGIAMEWAFRGWAVWVGDPKRIEFLGLRKWPNVQIVATTIEQQMAMLWDAAEIMEHRYRLVESGQATEDDFEPLLVLMDEYTEFRSAAIAWWTEHKHKGAPTKNPIFGAISSVARLGRAARIHLRFGIQRPDAELLTGEMRDNLADRHSLGRLSPNGAQMMWESSFAGTSTPRGIPGRGTSLGPDGQPTETQAYWTPDPRKVSHARPASDIAILEGLYPAQTTHRRFTYEIEDEDATTWLGDDGKSVYTPWAAVTQARRVPAEDAERHYELSELLDELAQRRKSDPDRQDPSEERHLSLVREDDDVDVDDYGPTTTVAADRLRPGDLTLVEDQWVVIEEAEADPADDTQISIAWRSDDGQDAGDLVLDADGMVEIRRMND